MASQYNRKVERGDTWSILAASLRGVSTTCAEANWRNRFCNRRQPNVSLSHKKTAAWAIGSSPSWGGGVSPKKTSIDVCRATRDKTNDEV